MTLCQFGSEDRRRGSGNNEMRFSASLIVGNVRQFQLKKIPRVSLRGHCRFSIESLSSFAQIGGKAAAQQVQNPVTIKPCSFKPYLLNDKGQLDNYWPGHIVHFDLGSVGFLG